MRQHRSRHGGCLIRQLIAGWGVKARQPADQTKENIMLYTIALVLIILWLLGLVTGTTMGGFIHVLLVIAIVMVLLRVISGRRAV
jgi:hypothetical protein